MNAPVIELTGICKTYNPGQASEVQVLHDIDLCLQAGEFAALVGPSGSGKSTLLNILGLLERPTAGSYRLQGQEVANLDDERLTLLRRRTLGFVFQFHHLLPAFTALENVTLPALMAQGRVGEAPLARARELLVAVGLERAMDRRPSQLSGGMLQRVAIARALMPQPAVVLMRRIHAEHGTCFLIVTHDPRLSDRCDRRIVLVDGRIAQDTRKPAAPSGAEVFP
jgi:lipoprotein-releasing system ATP-binding protein